jgi:3-oxoacyl-[acyl-carrier protein] reductase
VTIVSDAGRRGERFQAIYGAAKAGAMGFVRGLAAEVGAHGVTANCVSLGTMTTGVIQDAVATNPELAAKLSRAYTVPRLGRPEDPALLVALLCSEAGAWITGQVYPVDGGYASAL